MLVLENGFEILIRILGFLDYTDLVHIDLNDVIMALC